MKRGLGDYPVQQEHHYGLSGPGDSCWPHDSGWEFLRVKTCVKKLSARKKLPPPISGPAAAAQAFLSLAYAPYEAVYALYMDAGGHVLGLWKGEGGRDGALIDVFQIMRGALFVNALRVVLIHNHPAGTAKASAEDEAMFKRVRDAGRILGVSVADSIILGANPESGRPFVYSMFEQNAINL